MQDQRGLPWTADLQDAARCGICRAVPDAETIDAEGVKLTEGGTSMVSTVRSPVVRRVDPCDC